MGATLIKLLVASTYISNVVNDSTVWVRVRITAFTDISRIIILA